MSSGGSNSQRDPYPFPKARFDIFFNSQASSIIDTICVKIYNTRIRHIIDKTSDI